jgi:hypothetical protein
MKLACLFALLALFVSGSIPIAQVETIIAVTTPLEALQVKPESLAEHAEEAEKREKRPKNFPRFSACSARDCLPGLSR